MPIMPIKREEVAHFARISGFALSEEELDQFTPQLDEILTAVTAVQDVECEGIPPTKDASQLTEVLRGDVGQRPSDPLTTLDHVPAAAQLRFNTPRIAAED
jgi:aspartyl-tRNA(Asn)/glutamyl-tRNA(Gln) amidotransferase subunit C